MDNKFSSLKTIGKLAYIVGILLFFNFFFGLLFFRFIYWVLFGAVLLFCLAAILALGKRFLFASFNKYESQNTSTHPHEDVIDVEAEVFEENDEQEN